MGQSMLDTEDVSLTRNGVNDLHQVIKSLEPIEIQLSVLSIQMEYEQSAHWKRA